MGVTNIIKQLICDEDNNITINTAISGLVSTAIIGTLIYAFFYLPYMIMFHAHATATLGNVIMGIIGIISWMLSVIYACELLKKHGDRVLYTWK